MIQDSAYTQTAQEGRPEDALDMEMHESAKLALMQALTNLYSRPREAVVREFISNALDSHQRAGATSPVHAIFNLTHGVFTVTDQGEGMSREDVETIYSRYGASLAREDRKSRGGFGLGAKSALAITNQFTISTVKNGTALTFTVNSGDYYNPSYVKFVKEESTDQPNGTTVIIPSDQFTLSPHLASPESVGWLSTVIGSLRTIPHDRLTVSYIRHNEQKEAVRATFADSSQYEVVGEDILGEPLGWWDNRTVEMGVAVGPDLYVLDADERETIFGKGSRYDRVFLDMPVGSVQFPPSREQLMLTDRTIKAIRDRMTLFSAALLEKRQKEIDETVESHLGAYHQYRYLTGYSLEGHGGHQFPWMWQGDLIQPFLIPGSDIGGQPLADTPVDVFWMRSSALAKNYSKETKQKALTEQRSGGFPRLQKVKLAYVHLPYEEMRFVVNDLTEAQLEAQPKWLLLKDAPEVESLEVDVCILLSKEQHALLSPWAKNKQTLPLTLSELLASAEKVRADRLAARRAQASGDKTARRNLGMTNFMLGQVEKTDTAYLFRTVRAKKTAPEFQEALKSQRHLDLTLSGWSSLAPARWNGKAGEVAPERTNTPLPNHLQMMLHYLYKVTEGQSFIITGGLTAHTELAQEHDLELWQNEWVQAVDAAIIPGATVSYEKSRHSSTLPLEKVALIRNAVAAVRSAGIELKVTADEVLVNAYPKSITEATPAFPHANFLQNDADRGYQASLLEMVQRMNPLGRMLPQQTADSNLRAAHTATIENGVRDLLTRLTLLRALGNYTTFTNDEELLRQVATYWEQYAK